MNRDELSKALSVALEPLVRDLSEHLTAIATTWIMSSFDAAKSTAIASVREEGHRDDVRADRIEDRAELSVREEAAVIDAGPEDGEPQHGDLDAGRDAGEDDRDAAPAAAEGPAETPTVKKRATIRCSKCGELGKRADSCGITHNVLLLADDPLFIPASAPPEKLPTHVSNRHVVVRVPSPPVRTPATFSPPPRDRFKAIEAAAKQRKFPAPPLAPRDTPLTDEEQAELRSRGLPEPLSTFTV